MRYVYLATFFLKKNKVGVGITDYPPPPAVGRSVACRLLPARGGKVTSPGHLPIPGAAPVGSTNPETVIVALSEGVPRMINV